MARDRPIRAISGMTQTAEASQPDDDHPPDGTILVQRGIRSPSAASEMIAGSFTNVRTTAI